MDTKLEIFNGALRSVLNTHAPTKTIQIRSRLCTFVTQEIKDLMVSRDRVHNRFLVTRDALDWKNFQESRDSVKRRLSKAERKNTSEEVQLHKHNPNSLGKIINRVIPYKNQERLTYSKDLTTTANKFDRFFSLVGRNATNASIRLAEENNITLPEPSPETVPLLPDELFRLRTVTCKDVNSPCHFISPVEQVSWFR